MSRNNGVILDITEFIPVGHRNAVSRKELGILLSGYSDRQIRQAIEESDAPIVNLGYGYFIPDPEDEVDRSEAASYVAAEHARARSIEEKLRAKYADYEHVNEQLELELAER